MDNTEGFIKTDLEKFKDLYKSVGIDLKEEIIRDGYMLEISADCGNKKIDGYFGFSTKIYFSKKGKFKLQSITEG